MKLTYWIAPCINDGHESNTLRAKTKKGVIALVELNTIGGSWHKYEEPRKVTVNFDDSFDLMNQCLTDRGYWE